MDRLRLSGLVIQGVDSIVVANNNAAANVMIQKFTENGSTTRN